MYTGVGRLELSCKTCGKKFFVNPARKNKAGYCSIQCYWKTMKGKATWNKGKKCPNMVRTGSSNHRWKDGRSTVGICCDCGGPMSHKRNKRCMECYLKYTRNIKGPNRWNWKGGRVPLQKKIRFSFEYRQWRSDVFTRDEFTCQICGKKGGKLNAHHEKRFHVILEEYNIKTLEEALACEELWNINNGKTLCENCHSKFYTANIGKKKDARYK